MTLIKRKVIGIFVCSLCFLFIISKLYGATCMYSQIFNINNGSIKHGVFSSSVRQSNINLQLAPKNYFHSALTKSSVHNVQNSMRTNEGIHLREEHSKQGIRDILPANGNLLVWGLMKDHLNLLNMTSGKVFFIEDERNARKLSDNEVSQKRPLTKAYRVQYKVYTYKSFSKYVNQPEMWHELDLFDQLPDSVTQTHWNAIIAVIPPECCEIRTGNGTGNGHYQSIYTSWKLADKDTHIFVDNFECEVEHEFSINLFGKPLEVFKTQTMEIPRITEQAHFIIHANNVFKSNSLKSVNGNEIVSNSAKLSEVGKYKGVKHNWALLVAVNNGYFDFFNNWRLYFVRLNISLPVYVIAEDNIVYNKLTDIKDIGMTIQRSDHISINTSEKFGSISFRKMMSARPSYILSFIEKGMDIIFSDLDSVWLKNPLPYLTGNFDIWSQVDFEPLGVFCAGFLAVKSNKETYRFIRKWHNALKVKPMVNQPIFNKLLKQSPLNVKALNTGRFPSGKQYFDQYSEEERAGVVVVHNNWIIGHDKKLERFKKMNLWMNDTFS